MTRFPLRAVLLLALISVEACAEDPIRTSPDAGTVDVIDEVDAQPCTVATFYGDQDGDGFGTPNLIAVDCVAPEGFVDNDLDCDDVDSRNNPDASELCDGLDNDCDVATVEVCPANCLPQLTTTAEGIKSYLFCNTTLTHAAAQTTCEGAGMQFVRIDDQLEQDYLSAQRIPAFGGRAETWIGASDLVENNWVWADGTGFWLGRANGAPVNALFSRWNGGEPNNGDGVEDCALMIDSAAGQWDDRPCGQGRRFICERAAAP